MEPQTPRENRGELEQDRQTPSGDEALGDRASKGHPWLAWLVVLAVGVVLVVAQTRQPETDGGSRRLQRAVLEFESRYLVGVARRFGAGAMDSVRRQLEKRPPGATWRELRVAVLEGELVGPDSALERLLRLEARAGRVEGFDEPVNQRLMAALARVYQDRSEARDEAAVLPDADRRLLREELGWFGKLALAPPGEESELRREAMAAADRAVVTIAGGILAVLISGAIGLAILVYFFALLFGGRLDRSKWHPEFGGIYAETFAAWLVLFLALSLLTGFAVDAAWASMTIPLLGSLLALAWPMLRGVPWIRLRQDIGWTRGRHVGVELLAGVGCTMMAIPLVVLGLILMVILASATGMAGNAEPGVSNGPSHPAVALIVQASWWERALWLLVVSVVAPIVEETIFRGVLYRHLREATSAMRPWLGVLASGLFASFLFAAIHPQGLLGIPVITGLALAFSFMREWRGTILPAVVAHGINNAVVMAVLIAILTA